MDTSKFGMGRLPAPDPRDAGYRMRALTPRVTPAKRPRQRAYHLGPTQFQGDTPQCVGYSCRHKLTAAPIMVKAADGLTPEVIYRGAQDNDEWPGSNYDGTSVRGAFKFLQGQGYLASYVWGQTTDEIAAFLRDGHGTVILGTNWYESMFEPDPLGFLHLPANTRVSPVGGHAFHLFWAHPDRDEWWFQNSWEEWGVRIGGRPSCFKLREADVARLLSEDGEAGAGIEQKVARVS